jgi:hypothetical protein
MDEFLRHPFTPHHDLINAVSRIYDIDPQVPQIFESTRTACLMTSLEVTGLAM